MVTFKYTFYTTWNTYHVLISLLCQLLNIAMITVYKLQTYQYFMSTRKPFPGKADLFESVINIFTLFYKKVCVLTVGFILNFCFFTSCVLHELSNDFNLFQLWSIFCTSFWGCSVFSFA